MLIQFLGTSSGVPTRRRSLSALAVRAHGERRWLLVDCGEGTQHRLLRTGFSLATLACICITHRHGDHCLGLPGLLGSASMDGRSAPLRIIAPEEICRFVTASLELTDSRLGFDIDFIDVASAQPLAPCAGLRIAATPLSHRVPSFAYTLTEASVVRSLDPARLEAARIPRGPVWGALQRGQDVSLADGQTLHAEDFLRPSRAPRKLVVGGDNDTPALLDQTCRDAHLLIHEATYTAEVAARVGPAPRHSSAAQVARFAARARLPSLILTHFSPRYGDRGPGPRIDDIADEARRDFSGDLWLARDLDCFGIDPSGRVARLDPAQTQGRVSQRVDAGGKVQDSARPADE